MSLNFLENLRDIAVNRYDIDPLVFIVLVIVTTPFYYGSLFVIGKVIYKLKSKHKLNNKEILGHHKFIIAFIINQIAWVLPNIYIIFWGKNLPLWLWILIILNIVLTLSLFYSKIFKHLKRPIKAFV